MNEAGRGYFRCINGLFFYKYKTQIRYSMFWPSILLGLSEVERFLRKMLKKKGVKFKNERRFEQDKISGFYCGRSRTSHSVRTDYSSKFE
jgi:hypothetical protein